MPAAMLDMVHEASQVGFARSARALRVFLHLSAIIILAESSFPRLILIIVKCYQAGMVDTCYSENSLW
jgi:hypothetical protein